MLYGPALHVPTMAFGMAGFCDLIFGVLKFYFWTGIPQLDLVDSASIF